MKIEVLKKSKLTKSDLSNIKGGESKKEGESNGCWSYNHGGGGCIHHNYAGHGCLWNNRTDDDRGDTSEHGCISHNG